jgi:aspartate-semialdehyde dehydrogenase
MKTYKVAVLGATGAVGQKFIRLLDGHPQFRLTEVVASERSAGKRYAEAANWLEPTPLPEPVAAMKVRADTRDLDADVCFSALPGGRAGDVERDLARRGYKVFTNARDLRMAEDVPLVIAEVNPDHLALVDVQRRGAGSEGYVVANGNCTSIILTLPLKPLHDTFGVERVSVVTLQALSGAGYPGVASLDITENVVPHIGGEEDKVETESLKFLGRLNGSRVEPLAFPISATCTRVPVLDGHTEAVSVALRDRVGPEEVRRALSAFRGEPQRLRLASAPDAPILVRDEPDRPQPRKDRDAGRAMSVTVGRIRPDAVVGGVKFVVTGSNTVRGAAGASILNAELAAARGLL